MFAQGIVQNLVENKLLIDSSITELSTAEFPLILQHRILPVVSFPSEWCSGQLKAAALMVLDLEIALRASGLTVEDVNPWNLLFDGPQPVFVDFSAIAPIGDPRDWRGRRLFREFFLNPLALFEQGLGRIARRMLYDPWTGVTDYEIERIRTFDGESLSGPQIVYRMLKKIGKAPIPVRLRPAVKNAAHAVADALFAGSRKPREPDDALDEILALRERVVAMAVEGPRTSWGKYYDKNFPGFEASPAWTQKHRSVNEIILKLEPRSLLDFGANRGWYSQLAAHRGIRVIAADSDESALNQLYNDSAVAKTENVCAVYLDAKFPEPARGPAYQFLESAAKRFRSDMVLALAVVHHLVFSGNLSFEQIVRNFRMFCGQWLVVEFVGPEDPAVRCFPSAATRPWYNEGNFRSALNEQFDIIETLPSDIGGLDIVGEGPDARTIFVCEAKGWARAEDA